MPSMLDASALVNWTPEMLVVDVPDETAQPRPTFSTEVNAFDWFRVAMLILGVALGYTLARKG
jgi:hypothetical protein